MIDIEAHLDELKAMGLNQRMRLVSGPQGPHIVLDGKPVLLLCSSNYLGLADHPRVREAAADAAMRWGVGAGASRSASGTMTVHRRLEERLAAFTRREAALLFGSEYLAGAGVVSALAGPGDVIFSDALNHAALIDGCRLSGAEVFVYEHGDLDHLEWGIRRAEGRGALIATHSVFAVEGDLAPLESIVELAADYDLRTVIDEGHAIGAIGPEGRGALADAGLEAQVDVVLGPLGNALGSYGAFAACDGTMSRYLAQAARTFAFSSAPAPPVVAGALAALGLIEERPRRVGRLAASALALRTALGSEGFEVDPWGAHIVALEVGDARLALRICEAALADGLFVQAVRPPAVAVGTALVRLTAMATHREEELRAAARTLARTARAAGLDPRVAPSGSGERRTPALTSIFDYEARAA